MSLAQDLIETAIADAKRYQKQVGDALEKISDSDIHEKNNETNSIAILVQHIHGSHLRRWKYLFAAETPALPPFDTDFQDQGLDKKALQELNRISWGIFIQALSALKPEDLQKDIVIRNEPQPLHRFLVRQLQHYSYHVGQIALLTKAAVTAPVVAK